MADRSALHQARLLESRLRRRDSTRRNQRDAADSAFRADARAIWGNEPAWKRELVLSALRVDQDNAHLFAELEAAERELDPHERRTDAPPAPLQLTNGGAHPMEPTDLGGVEIVDTGVIVVDSATSEERELAEAEGYAVLDRADGRVELQRREPPPPVMPRPGGAVRIARLDELSGQALDDVAAMHGVSRDEPAPSPPDGVVDASGVFHAGLRYPEPGEPARLLPDGVTAVVDEEALAAMGAP